MTSDSHINIANDKPFLTVVLPVRNEAAFIEANLRALLAQEYPPERMEILVVDGRSDDDTAARTQALAAHDPRIRLLDNPGRIVSTGLNLALAQSHGDIIVWVDGHMLLEPNYLAEAVRAFAEHPEAWCVGGPIVHAGTNLFGRAVAAAQSHPFGVGNARHRYASYEGFGENAVNPAYRRWIFERVGNFDEDLVRNQDDEFAFRITQAGGKVFISQKCRSVYYVRDSFSKLFRQYVQYSFWRIPMLKKHRRPTHLRQLVPPVFFLVMFALAVAGIVMGSPLVALALPVAYATALVIGGLTTAPRIGLLAALLVPFAFLAMHLGYAYGYWYGLFSALFRRNVWQQDGTMAKLSR